MSIGRICVFTTTSQGMEKVLRHKGGLKDIQENRAVDVLPSAKPEIQTEV